MDNKEINWDKTQNSSHCVEDTVVIPSVSPLSPWSCLHTDRYFCISSWEWSLVLGGCSVHMCGSTAGWECQGFNALGLIPTSVGQKLVDKYLSILMPQWNNPKMHFIQSFRVPLRDWASVAHSGKLVINMFLYCFVFISCLPRTPTPLQCSLRPHPKGTLHPNPCLRLCCWGNHRPGMPTPLAFCWC